jgi:hypothetical protein
MRFLPSLSGMNSLPFDQLTFEFFTRLLKTNFRVQVDARDSIELQLSEITPSHTSPPAGPNGPIFENFSLFFLGPPDPVLPQKIYPFESAPHGRFELFIVPIGRDQNGTRYQAIFSRLVKSG